MKLSVAICTRDRAELLRQCLASLSRMHVPAGATCEIIVVDNGSSDHTANVAAAFAGTVRTVREAAPGLGHARNRAVAEATGDYILWTDDDAQADPGWLAAYAEAFRRYPDAAVFGGPIEPALAGDPPSWLVALLPRIGGAFALRDLGSEPLALAAPAALPYGANYAVRMTEQRAHPYAPHLGRQPGGLGLGNEEMEVMSAILEAGGNGRWVPDARVRHHVGPERQTLDYLRRFLAAEGAFAEASGRAPPASTAHLLRTMLHAELRYGLRSRLSAPDRWITDLIIASEARGRLAARRQRQRQPASSASAASPVRVASWPHWYAPNPYLRLFYGALRDHGIDHVENFPIDAPPDEAARQIDVLHLHWAYPYWRDGGRGAARQWLRVGRLARQLRALRRAGVRVAWTLHNLEQHEHGGAADTRADRLLHGLADLRIVHSATALERVRAQHPGGGAIVCMPHGNYCGAFPPGAPRERTRAQLGVSGDAPLLLCFGQLREYKGFDVAVRAMDLLPGCHLVVAGRSVAGTGERLTEVAGQRASVRLETGDASDERLADLLTAADVVLLPYRAITTSGALMAALTFARPVVCTDLPYFRELLAEPAAAFAEPDSIASLAGAVQRVLATPREAREAAAAAIAARYGWADVVTPVAVWLTQHGRTHAGGGQ